MQLYFYDVDKLNLKVRYNRCDRVNNIVRKCCPNVITIYPGESNTPSVPLEEWEKSVNDIPSSKCKKLF